MWSGGISCSVGCAEAGKSERDCDAPAVVVREHSFDEPVLVLLKLDASLDSELGIQVL